MVRRSKDRTQRIRRTNQQIKRANAASVAEAAAASAKFFGPTKATASSSGDKRQTASSVNNRRLEYVQSRVADAHRHRCHHHHHRRRRRRRRHRHRRHHPPPSPLPLTTTAAAARRWLHRHSPLPPPAPVARRYQGGPGASGPPMSTRYSRFQPKVVWNTAAFHRSRPPRAPLPTAQSPCSLPQRSKQDGNTDEAFDQRPEPGRKQVRGSFACGNYLSPFDSTTTRAKLFPLPPLWPHPSSPPPPVAAQGASLSGSCGCSATCGGIAVKPNIGGGGIKQQGQRLKP